jgi:hypothetical protein
MSRMIWRFWMIWKRHKRNISGLILKYCPSPATHLTHRPHLGWRVLSSGIYLRVVRWKWTDFSEEHLNFSLWSPPAFRLVSFSAYSSSLKIVATCSPVISVDFQRTTWPYIPEKRTLHIHRCEHLKSSFRVAHIRTGLVPQWHRVEEARRQQEQWLMREHRIWLEMDAWETNRVTYKCQVLTL